MTAAAINKTLLARSFNRAAGDYLQHSQLQQGISRRLLSLLNGRPGLAAAQVLEVGCGTGFSTYALARYIPTANITAVDLAANMIFAAQHQLSQQLSPQFVCADMEKLPFAPDCFDMVFSSSAIHWSADRQTLVAELYRILRPAGMLCLSSYGHGTLAELRNSWAHTDSYAHTIDFESHQQLSQRLSDCGFHVQRVHRQTEVVLYDSVTHFLHSLKSAGIVNCRRDRYCAGLTTPGRLARMQNNYQAHYALGAGIRASYDVIFIIANKAA